MNKHKQPQQSSNNRHQRPATGGQPRSDYKQRPNGQTSRGEAARAGRMNSDMANKLIDVHNIKEVSEDAKKHILPVGSNKVLRWTPLGGQEGIGEKNMQVLEYDNTAIIMDCGMDLQVDLPGINYLIPDYSYLESIKHKIKGYVISHGHLDHIGALPYILPKYPAPVYGSHFTIGMVKKVMEDEGRGPIVEGFTPEYVEILMDNHERIKVGDFTIELVRMTHSIPDGTAIVVDTPEGRVINSGDYRLDPEPLDHMPTDVERLTSFGKDGKTILLMGDSTQAQRLGRTPTEHTLQPAFMDIIKNAPGRVFVASFSSNINRVQMIINAAVASGRRVAIDGRSMLAHMELAVKLGSVKIPKGLVSTVRSMPKMPDDKILMVVTGGQGELNASLQRMSIGEHRHIKLKAGDTIVVSSTPIPGNEVRYQQIADDVTKLGAHLYQAPTHEVDGVGPLHVSGHGFREEHVDLYNYIKPKYFVPIFAGARQRKLHIENLVQNAGMSRESGLMVGNGESLEIYNGKIKFGPSVPWGARLIDNTGSIVSSVVVKDRLLMSEAGIVSVVLTIDRRTGHLLASPDIVTRGFIYMRENESLMNEFRDELKRVVGQRFGRVDVERFKAELKDHIAYYLYEKTRHSPIIIPVVNVVGSSKELNKQKDSQAELRGHSQPD